ncbi:TPA: hypothetical protein I7784_20600 [Vibrio vulnificus]|nr:hypothetical protein [Vibrio vulnificus]
MISFCKVKLTFFTRSEKLAKHTMGQNLLRSFASQFVITKRFCRILDEFVGVFLHNTLASMVAIYKISLILKLRSSKF